MSQVTAQFKISGTTKYFLGKFICYDTAWRRRSKQC